MKLEINEEEQAFLERVCDRAEKLAFISQNDIDLEKIRILRTKLIKLDSNLRAKKLAK